MQNWLLALMVPSCGKSGPSPSAFIVCHGYGRAYRTAIALNSARWQAARAVFAPEPRASIYRTAQYKLAVIGSRPGSRLTGKTIRPL